MGNRRNTRLLTLEQLVIDSSRFGFNEQEALSYIESRTGGKGIARSRYYQIKEKLSQNEFKDCKNRMAYHSKAGFVINHFKRMAELEHLQSILFKAMYNETSKPVKDQSLFAISKLASNIGSVSQLLVYLNISSPIVDQMKAEIDKALEAKNKRLKEMKVYAEEEPVPSGLYLPKDFFKPSAFLTNASDRVF
jgi:hypothetical protein